MQTHVTLQSALWAATGALLALSATYADAQPMGTFSWQLQPFCNVITVNVVQTGSVYTLDGFDNQCGAPQRALVVGTATLNPDGSVGFGLHLVTSPRVASVGIEARISLGTLSGTWQDSAGNSGAFAFGQSTGGSARPQATSVQVFSSGPVDFSTTISSSLTVPIAPDVFNQGLWNIYLVHSSGIVYSMPGPGSFGVTTYRSISLPNGVQTNIVVGRAAGPGEAYSEIRVIWVR
jgi:hypothetical protein